MRLWRGRRCPVAEACLSVAGISLAVAGLAFGVPGAAGASEGSTSDQRDVGFRLDLKALGHADDGGLVVHTAETHVPFTDQWATFKWGIDLDHDEAFDLVVFTEWRGGKLVGGVKDTAGREVAAASVARPTPTVIKVSFPAQALGGATVYRYAVSAEGPGERDLAPNSGLVQHRLGNIVEAGGGTGQETRTASAAPAAAPAPAAVASPVPAPERKPAAAAAAPAPAPAKAPAPAGATPSAAPKAPATNLPATGPEDRRLLPWAGGVLMAGGGLVALGAQRKRLHRAVSTGGNR